MIHHLAPDNYLGPAEAAALERTSADTHNGWIRLPDATAATLAVVKVYPPVAGSETRELLNEFIGHFLAERFRFPVPEQAGTILIERRQWPALSLWKRLPARTPRVVAWWTQRSPLLSVKARFRLDVLAQRDPLFRKQFDALVAELLQAHASPGIVAFDHLIANIDRNVGNLLGPEGSRYLLIDHGQCLTGQRWNAAQLNPAQDFPNVLRTILGGDKLPLPFKNSTVATFDRIAPIVSATMTALREALHGAVSDKDADAIIEFFQARAHRDTAARRLGLVA